MRLFVTFGAQRDQVLFHIATRLAAEFEVVYLWVLHATASLASPAVALQHLPMQFAVAVRIESESGLRAASSPRSRSATPISIHYGSESQTRDRSADSDRQRQEQLEMQSQRASASSRELRLSMRYSRRKSSANTISYYAPWAF